MLFSFTNTLFAQGMPISMEDMKKYAIYGVAGLGGLVLLFLLFRGKKKHDPEGGLAEDLSEYPPPPKASSQRLLVQGQPMRLRLVVIAPVGKKPFAKDGNVEPVLDDVVPGLGDVAAADKARIRVWPPQLSAPGFPPTFWRLTERPAKQANNWVLVAGSAKANGQPILLGLALWTDKPTKKGQLVLQPNDWSEALRVE